MKQIFIGSSSESIRYAEAIQDNINNSRIDNIQAICWHQGVFKIGHSTLEDLLLQLDQSDFGVFVFAKDDYVKTRTEDVYCARDNVIFEMGLFLGALGRDHVFCIVPDDKKYHIPSDLQGINYTRYRESENNIALAVGTACTHIKEAIRRKMVESSSQLQVKKIGLFPAFDIHYSDLFANCNHITTYFIHSRKWRENNLKNIDDFLRREPSEWDVILPDISNSVLLCGMQAHFDDGVNMLEKIMDAYRFFYNYQKKYPNKIRIRSFTLFPTYSFYRFDDEIIVSMYPLTTKRHSTPTLYLSADSDSNNFFKIDIEYIIKDSMILSNSEVQKIIDNEK